MIRFVLFCSVFVNLLDIFPTFSLAQPRLLLFSQYYLWLLPIGLIFVWRGPFKRKKVLSLVILIVFARQLWPIASMYTSVAPVDTAQAKYKIAYVNNSQNIGEFISSKRPDVLIRFDEVQKGSMDLKEFPHAINTEKFSLYSKYPFEGEPYTDWGDAVQPAISALLFPEKIRFIVFKTLPYDSMEALATNRVYLRRIATEIRHKEDNLVMVGHFGVTIWSPYYKRFTSGSRALNVAGFFGVGRFFEVLFKIQTEHVLVKGKVVPVGMENNTDNASILEIDVRK